MAQYNEYKDSGIPWIGNVPSHWEVKPIRSILTVAKELNTNDRATLLTLSQYTGVNIRNGKEDSAISEAETLIGYNVVHQGQFVMNIMLAWNGSYGVSEFDGVISPAYAIFNFTKDVCKRYYHYLWRTKAYQDAFKTRSKGIVDSRLRLYPQYFLPLYTSIPPTNEQAAIVAYLDKVTADIDKAIAAKERIISALEERRKIIITEAVTRGINPDAPLRDSGIDWLGQIPAHWEVQRFKTLINLINTPSKSLIKIGLENIESHSGKFVASDSVFDGNGVEFNQGDIVYGKLRPYLRKVWIAEFDGNAVGDFFVFRSSNKICNEYLQFLMLSDSFTQIVTSATYGAKMPRVSSSTIMNLKIAYPSITEQNAIVSEIKDLTKSIDTAISQQRKAIDLLRERKAIIINEVVTGKVKVV